MITLNSIFHMLFRLFDPLDLASHLIFIHIFFVLYHLLCNFMVRLLFKFSWSKLDEIFTKSVSDCNQQPNKFRNSPRKEKKIMRSNIGGGSRVGMTAVKDSMFFFGPLPYLNDNKQPCLYKTYQNMLKK